MNWIGAWDKSMIERTDDQMRKSAKREKDRLQRLEYWLDNPNSRRMTMIEQAPIQIARQLAAIGQHYPEPMPSGSSLSSFEKDQLRKLFEDRAERAALWALQPFASQQQTGDCNRKVLIPLFPLLP